MSPRLRGVTVALAAVGVALALTAGATRLDPVGERLADAGPATRALPTTLGNPDLVCPGPETLQVPEGGSATAPGGPVVVTSVLAAQAPATGSVKATGDPSSLAAGAAKSLPTTAPVPIAGRSLALQLTEPGIQVKALAVTGLGPVRVQAGPGGTTGDVEDLPVLGATQSTLARAGDLRGLTSTGCGEATTDSWLVGGATRSGERLRLLLSNPAATPAVVVVQVFGPKGRVEAPAGDGVAVPAGGQVPLYIDALAPGLSQVAVHVSARTGRVRAVLHDSLLRGLTAGGTDDVAAGQSPAKKQLIPAVSLVNGYGKGADDPDQAGSTSVRVAVPGTEEAVVRVSLRDSTGEVQLPTGAVQNVRAGSVVDIPVSGVPSGTYTALVESDVPIVAGARVGRVAKVGGRPGGEFGWARSGTPLSGDGLVALPAGTAAALSLAATGAAGSVQLRTISADGTESGARPLPIEADRAGTIQIPPGTVAIRLNGFTGGPLVGSVVLRAADPNGELISVLPVLIATEGRTTSVVARDERLGLG